jgi:hypothetical protein
VQAATYGRDTLVQPLAVIHEAWVITRWGQSKCTQTILSVSKGPQKSSFSVWRESWPMWVMARKAVCLVSMGLADQVVTYVSITWQLGNSMKPSNLQQFCSFGTRRIG